MEYEIISLDNELNCKGKAMHRFYQSYLKRFARIEHGKTVYKTRPNNANIISYLTGFPVIVDAQRNLLIIYDCEDTNGLWNDQTTIGK